MLHSKTRCIFNINKRFLSILKDVDSANVIESRFDVQSAESIVNIPEQTFYFYTYSAICLNLRKPTFAASFQTSQHKICFRKDTRVWNVQ